jgi:uncharacterized protein involved in exopolysaccharide biosynthesis
VGGTLLGAVIGFVVVKLFIVPTFESTAVLKYEGDLRIAGLHASTQYSIGPAADALGRQQVLVKIGDELGYAGSLKGLANSIEYQTDLRAQTLRVTGYATTAKGAADFVAVVVDVFLQYHRERQARRVEQEIGRIATRIAAAERSVDEARRRYNDFRERHGVADLSTEQESLVESAASLRADSQLTASEVRALEARVKSLEVQLASVPKTSAISTGVGAEQATYEDLRQQLVQARASLSDEHPRVQALEQQVEQVRKQVRGGGGISTVGVNATYLAIDAELREARAQLTTLTERQKGLEEMAQRAEGRVKAFAGVEGDLSELLAEVEVNEALLVDLRATEAALEDALEDPPSGFTVLEPAAIPEFPLPSKRKAVFVLILGLSFLLALALVLRREFKGLRLQTPAEVAFWGNGPVLGTTAWPRDSYGLDELVGALDDYAPDARGTLMLVGGRQGEDRLALDLARRMNTDWFTGAEVAGTGPTGSGRPASGPIHATPPTGPYPVGGGVARASAAPARSSALAVRPVQLVRREPTLEIHAWDGSFEGQALRRAARLADRVIVLVRADSMTPVDIHGIRRRLGREGGIGFIVLDLADEYQSLPDRIGDVTRFWAT